VERRRADEGTDLSYTLVEQLGKGGMGAVWKARDDDTGQMVALKLLHEAFAGDDDYRQRFEHELSIARRIDSPHVVKVLGFGEREGVPYIAFELVEGPSLRQLLKGHGPYSWAEARVLMLQLAEGLADAHATGVVHRDVKPSNILIAPDGTVKLADFGISHAVDMTRLTQSSGVMGTPSYVAPEGPVDARSDLYSLGVVLYEVLTGSPPFKGATYHEVLSAHLSQAPDLAPIPAEQRPLLAWLLAKDPADRPQSARQLIRALMGEEQIPETDSQTTIAMRARAMTAPAAADVPVKPDQPKAPVVPAAPSLLSSTTTPIRIPPPSPPAEPSGSRLLTPPLLVAGAVALVVVLAGAWLVFGAGGGASASPTPGNVSVATSTATPVPTPTPTPTPEPTPTPVPLVKWTKIGTIPETVFGDTAALLPNGKVIVFSTSQGSTHAATGNTWIVDPDSGAVTAGPAMAALQSAPGVARLTDGSVFVVGGWDSQIRPVTSAEILNPAGTAWTAVAPMNVPRSQAMVVELADGRVLVAGGWTHKNNSDSWNATNTAEIYDRAANSWTPTQPMPTAVALGAATLLPDGKALVTGGDSAWPKSSNQTVLASSEVLDPATLQWTPVSGPSARAAQFAAPLPNGQILVTGGWADGQELGLATTVSYDPATASFGGLADMPGGHAQGRAVVLRGGEVVIIGGWDAASKASNTVDVYDPQKGTWGRLASMIDPVYWPAAVVLPDGRVFVAGGWTDKSPSHVIEVLGP
jgi:serine/threonine protein kinase